MELSKEIGITVKKNENFSEWYTQTVLKAQLADYAPVKGLIVLRPYGYSIWESLKSSLDQKLKATGHENGFLPVLIPESLLSKESDHFAGFTPEVFWVTHSGETEIGDKLALRPTSEALAYSMYSKWIKSWRDLPLKINFWNTALRAEIKATKPFLRTSEFLWQEGHTVHTTKEEAENEVTAILDMYKKTVEEELAIPVITGRKSEKEKFVGAVYTTTMESIMPDGKALQMGTSHLISQSFAKSFGMTFQDRSGQVAYPYLTSWAVTTRLVGALVMSHGDQKGLVIPPKIAPIQVVIIPIWKDDTAQSDMISYAKNVMDVCSCRVHIDIRDYMTVGEKFYEWEKKGVPVRIEVGAREKENQTVSLVRRDTGDKQSIAMSNLSAFIPSFLEDIQRSLFERAEAFLRAHTVEIDNYTEFQRALDEHPGFFYTHWCGSAECEKRVHDETKATIRCIPFNQKKKKGKCMVCGADTDIVAVFAKAY